MNSTRDHGAKAMRDDAHLVACASLKSVDLFSDLSNSKLYDLAGAARFRKVASRELLVASNATPDCLHFLIQGAGKVSRMDVNGRETLLYLIKPGEMFGGPLSGAHDPEDTTIVRALEPCTVARVLVKDVESAIGSAAYLAAVGQITSQRLRGAEERLDELTMRAVPCRTARVLLRLCSEFPQALDCGIKVDVLLTQQDLAGMVGATRERVNAILETFRREGWLDIHDRYMCIHRRDELAELAFC
jgi:CRP/FNR family transcriptional regulator, cyclic AMP receptor protein